MKESLVNKWIDRAKSISVLKEKREYHFFDLLLEVYKHGYSDGFEVAKDLFEEKDDEENTKNP